MKLHIPIECDQWLGQRPDQPDNPHGYWLAEANDGLPLPEGFKSDGLNPGDWLIRDPVTKEIRRHTDAEFRLMMGAHWYIGHDETMAFFGIPFERTPEAIAAQKEQDEFWSEETMAARKRERERASV